MNAGALPLLVAALLTVLTGQVRASPLFASDDLLDVTVTGNFTALFRTSGTDASLPFEIEVAGARDEIMVRLRGHSRLRVCDFPPLRIDFPQQRVRIPVFAGQYRLKLATHCRNTDRSEQDLLEEYLAYRILNVLTDVSYRVRPLRLSYVDSGGRLPARARHRHGFLIEHGRELRNRTGTRRVDLTGVPKNRHDEEQAALIYVFQYLIGNTDWSLVRSDHSEFCCHNVDLVEKDGKVLFVPYDFDLAGLVNAVYAYPDPSLRIRRVTQRVYRGVCTDREVLERAIAKVNAGRARIIGPVAEVPGLSAKSVNRARAYLQRFFDRASEKDALLREFEKNCL